MCVCVRVYRHGMEIVATAERSSRGPQHPPKHCGAENKHRAAFLQAVASFSNCGEKKIYIYKKKQNPKNLNILRKLNVFLASMSGQPRKTMYLYRRVPQLGSSVLSEGGRREGGIFQHLGADVSRALVHYISVTLPLLKVRWRAAGLSALGHGYLSPTYARTHAPPQDMHMYLYKKARFSDTSHLYLCDRCPLMLLLLSFFLLFF